MMDNLRSLGTMYRYVLVPTSGRPLVAVKPASWERLQNSTSYYTAAAAVTRLVMPLCDAVTRWYHPGTAFWRLPKEKKGENIALFVIVWHLGVLVEAEVHPQRTDHHAFVVVMYQVHPNQDRSMTAPISRRDQEYVKSLLCCFRV